MASLILNKMNQYSLNKSKYGTHSLVAREIGKNKSVLDVGCNKGYLSLVSPGNDFYGIDSDNADLQIAKKINKYKEVYQIDLNQYQQFKTRVKFDVIVFADILEHLIFPELVLKYFVNNYLKHNGKVIISLPNIANIVTRLNLLTGKFDYTESGILDKTHLHLYTNNSATKLIKDVKLKIIKTVYSSNTFGRLIQALPVLGTLLGYNLIYICRKKS